jgi:signal transduction histidine kinase
MTLTAAATPSTRSRGLLLDLVQVLRTHLPRPRKNGEEVPTPQDALLRALCHDMSSPLAALEATLGHLDRMPADRAELMELARAQTAHLSSMLRTAAATSGANRRGPAPRLLRDVLRAAFASCGLPASQLTVVLDGDAGEVTVGDARVQRIVTNLLENAHRHGRGAAVRLAVTRRPGWVVIELTQAGLAADRIADHLRTQSPPVDLTGLGLWSVQRQTRELGGRVVWEDDGAALTLIVELPDR